MAGGAWAGGARRCRVRRAAGDLRRGGGAPLPPWPAEGRATLRCIAAQARSASILKLRQQSTFEFACCWAPSRLPELLPHTKSGGPALSSLENSAPVPTPFPRGRRRSRGAGAAGARCESAEGAMVPGAAWSSFLAPEAAQTRCPCARAHPTPRTHPRDTFSKCPTVYLWSRTQPERPGPAYR